MSYEDRFGRTEIRPYTHGRGRLSISFDDDVESESAQVNRILVKVMNLYKKNKNPKLSKMIKSLKDNPTIKSLAYIQAKEL